MSIVNSEIEPFFLAISCPYIVYYNCEYKFAMLVVARTLWVKYSWFGIFR